MRYRTYIAEKIWVENDEFYVETKIGDKFCFKQPEEVSVKIEPLDTEELNTKTFPVSFDGE